MISIIDILANVGISVLSNRIYDSLKPFLGVEDGASTSAKLLIQRLEYINKIDKNDEITRIISFLSALGDESVDTSGLDSIIDIINGTSISMRCRSNYLDFLCDHVSRSGIFFDVDITNESEKLQAFEVDIFSAPVSGRCVGPFSSEYDGVRFNVSHMGNSFLVRPRETQTIKVWEFVREHTGTDAVVGDVKMLFAGDDDLEMCRLSKDGELDRLVKFNLSKFLPPYPDNLPFVGTCFSMRVRFLVGEWTVKRYFFGGLAEKDPKENLKKMLSHDECGSFFYLSDMIDSGIVTARKKSDGRTVAFFDKTSVHSIHLNECVTSSRHGVKYIHIFNKTEIDFISKITCLSLFDDPTIKFRDGFW